MCSYENDDNVVDWDSTTVEVDWTVLVTTLEIALVIDHRLPSKSERQHGFSLRRLGRCCCRRMSSEGQIRRAKARRGCLLSRSRNDISHY